MAGGRVRRRDHLAQVTGMIMFARPGPFTIGSSCPRSRPVRGHIHAGRAGRIKGVGPLEEDSPGLNLRISTFGSAFSPQLPLWEHVRGAGDGGAVGVGPAEG